MKSSGVSTPMRARRIDFSCTSAARMLESEQINRAKRKNDLEKRKLGLFCNKLDNKHKATMRRFSMDVHEMKMDLWRLRTQSREGEQSVATPELQQKRLKSAPGSLTRRPDRRRSCPPRPGSSQSGSDSGHSVSKSGQSGSGSGQSTSGSGQTAVSIKELKTVDCETKFRHKTGGPCKPVKDVNCTEDVVAKTFSEQVAGKVGEDSGSNVDDSKREEVTPTPGCDALATQMEKCGLSPGPVQPRNKLTLRVSFGQTLSPEPAQLEDTLAERGEMLPRRRSALRRRMSLPTIPSTPVPPDEDSDHNSNSDDGDVSVIGQLYSRSSSNADVRQLSEFIPRRFSLSNITFARQSSGSSLTGNRVPSTSTSSINMSPSSHSRVPGNAVGTRHTANRVRRRSVTGQLLSILAKSNENKTTREVLELDRERKNSAEDLDPDMKRFLFSARRRCSVSGNVCASMTTTSFP